MKLKPTILIYVLLAVMVTVNITAAAVDERQITITGIATSANTDPAHPGAFLADENPDTYWAVLLNTGAGWAELSLNQATLIYGLQLSGDLAAESSLTVESWQNGYWAPFCGGTLQAIPQTGIIDLSADRAVTAKLRLRLNDAGGGTSKLAAIKILGCPAASVFHRIQPREIKYSKDSYPTTPARFLSDRNIQTAWRTGDDENDCAEIRNNGFFIRDAFWDRKIRQTQTGAGRQVELELDGAYRLNNINLYITFEAAGEVIVKTGDGRHWREIGRFTLTGHPGWQRLDLSSQRLETDRVLLQLEEDHAGHSNHSKRNGQSSRSGRTGGIGEVELWGYGAYQGLRRRTLQPLPQLITQALNYRFEPGDEEELQGNRLELAVAGEYNHPVTIELNGLPVELPPILKINGNTVYRYPLPEDELWEGENFIRLLPGDPVFTLLQLQITGDGGDGEIPLQAGGLNDGLRLTPAVETGAEINLARESFIEAVEIYAPGNLAASISAKTNTGLIPLNQVQTGSGYRRFQGGISAAGLNIVNHAGIPFAEIRVLGNPGPNTAPEIKIIWPRPLNRPGKEIPGCDADDREYLLGRVDNPAATVTVNGKPTRQSGHYFWIRLRELGLDYGEVNTITVTATGPDGQASSKQLEFFWGDAPDYQLDQKDILHYTAQSTFTISGRVGSRQYQVLVGGKPVTLNHNRRFSAVVPLEEGYNLIPITFNYTYRGKEMHYTIYRRVVRDSSGPILTIDSPLPGTVTKNDSVVISGSVSGKDPYVKVNRTSATVMNGYFSSKPVVLIEGKNTIKVEATDSYGRKTTREVTVVKDTKAPVISNLNPADGFLSGKAEVTVTGKITDAGQVYVYANGKLAVYQNGSFSITLTLPDGENQLPIIAVDQAGNTATATLKIRVDTQPPLEFTPSADPADWTNNNKPTITFTTSDGFSGIDHYEIAVGDGTFKSPVASPYTFTTAIPDGEQTVKVKAVDKAGNYTIGEVKVYIDTVPPEIPINFEIIPGVNRVILKWQGEDPAGEIVGYRVHRSPVFSKGSYHDLTRASNTSDLSRFIDEDVTSGMNYTYRIQALDHGGNYSQATAEISVKAGVTSQAVDINGGTVKFDFCKLTLNQGTIDNQSQVIIRATTEVLPENPYGTKIGPAYNFTLLNQAGREFETKFAEPATLTISYTDLQLPEGFDPMDLGVYWYNKAGGYWEKLDYAINDSVNQTVTVDLLHFSDYQVMASEFNSPSLDSYYHMGISPFQAYFQDNIENVSPFSGGVTISATDFKIPGRMGNDLIIQRIYDSKGAEQERIIEANPDEYCKTPIDTFGSGWSLNIPWIEQTDKGKFVRLPGGQTIKIEMDSTGKFEYHKGIHFIMQKNSDSTFSLTMNDGARYEFDDSGRVTRQVDPAGKNELKYEYSLSNSRKLEKITDALGHTVRFSYGTNGLINEITAGKRRVSYDYTSSGLLAEVHDQMNRKTAYSYESHTFKSGIFSSQKDDDYSEDDNTFSYTVHLLNTITYPTGIKSIYTYEFRNQYYGEKIEKTAWGMTVAKAKIKYYGTKILIQKHTVAGKETIYSYQMNDRIGSFEKDTFVPAYIYMHNCKITEGERSNQIIFRQIAGNNWVDTPWRISNYEGALMAQNITIIKNDREVERILYQYDVPLRAITMENHYRGGLFAFSTTTQYDSWGNPTYRLDGSRNLEETWEYYKQKDLRFKNLVATCKRKNRNPINNTSNLVTTTFNYDDTIGKPLSVTVNDGTSNKTSSFAYYDNGNLRTKTDEFNENLKTEIFYDDTCQAFPVKQIVYGVKDADGNTGDIETKAGYDYETGLKQWEEDGRGYLTRYEYDNLNRVTKVILPDDDGDDTNNPYREYVFNDTGNTCIYYNEKRQKTTFLFDGLGRLTEVAKDTSLYPGGVKTKYRYNNVGQIDQVTDPLGNVTSYLYDGLNRVVKVTYPGGASVTVDYDDATNTVTVTDENGGKVTEQKDWANRLIMAKQFCSYEGATENIYTWQFFYDSLGNKIRQVDPKSNQTDQEYDPLGHLLKVQLPAAPVILPGATAVTDGYRPTIGYEYNRAGLKTAEISANENAKDTQDKNKTSYEYDQLGRLIKTTTRAKDVFTGETVSMVTRNYYDGAGNKIKTIDPKGGVWEYAYSARGYLLSEQDPLGNITRYRYDLLGNKVAVTDPRGNGADGSFTIRYEYDELNRLTRTILPDNTPGDQSDNPYTEITYDAAGNKLSERDANGVETSYTYTPRNWVETVSLNGQVKTRYYYDAKGNRIKVEDAMGNITETKYDSLGRVRRVIHPEGNTESFRYDEVGNRIAVIDGRNNRTEYTYDSLGRLTGVKDPLQHLTQYFYDPNGNQVKVITPNKLELVNQYDELNRLVANFDSLGKATKYSYDLNGNRKDTLDRRGSSWVYQYLPNNLLQRVDVTNGSESYYVEYTYDAAGNRMTVTDPDNILRYNYQDGVYQSDPLNRLNSVDKSFDGATYRTAYRYDKAGLLTGIKYPEAGEWLKYNYNALNQLNEVVGFTASQGITYDLNGALKSLTYANGAVANYGYDNNLRLKDLQVTVSEAEVLRQQYTYDAASNIKTIDDGKEIKTYDYDANNQLTRSITPGKFLEQDPTPGTYGLKVGDYLGATWMDFMPTINGMIGLDYNSSSIGIDFGTVAPGVKKILIIPDQAYQTHRVKEKTIDLYTSSDNLAYTIVPKTNWEFVKDDKGLITITLKERLATRYLKVHVKFDDRDADFKPKNKAQFLNELAKMLRVYQEATSRTEEFEYDAAGNRKLQRITLIQTTRWDSLYYSNSDRLKTDGKNAFKYDEAGNLIEKGNKFKINGDTVTFTTTGEGVEYWRYKYDLLNRLISVSKNGTIVSEYAYDPEGLRVVKRAKGETTHYVFEGTEPIFEKRINAGKSKSYVYAVGKHLARVDGVIGDTNAKVYFYHTDHLGSIRAVTDQTGKVVFQADHFAFGQRFGEISDFEEWHSFTGKEWDPDVGLYYFNARWYDPELGRFISEDPAADPNNPNLYSYCSNNPLSRTDPTGKFWWIVINAVISGISAQMNGGNFWAGAFMGAISGGISTGVNAALGAMGMVANNLGTMMLSGAIGGGLTSAAFGGDFWEGAGQGALAGALSWGASQLIPENYTIDDIIKSKNPLLDIVRYGLKEEIATGGKFNSQNLLSWAGDSYGYQLASYISDSKSVTLAVYMNEDGTRTVIKYKNTRDGIIVTKEEQKPDIFGKWLTIGIKIEGYNNQSDFRNGNAAFTMNNNGKVTTNSDVVNGNLLARACTTYLGNFSSIEAGERWYNLVKSGGNWDFKNPKQLPNVKFSFDGGIYSSEQFGNINYGYTGGYLGLPYNVVISGSVYADSYHSIAHDKHDWPYIALGYYHTGSISSMESF